MPVQKPGSSGVRWSGSIGAYLRDAERESPGPVGDDLSAGEGKAVTMTLRWILSIQSVAKQYSAEYGFNTTLDGATDSLDGVY